MVVSPIYYSDYIHGLLIVESKTELSENELTIFRCLIQLLTQVITMEIITVLNIYIYQKENKEFYQRDLCNNKLEFTHITSAISYLLQSILPPCVVTTLLYQEKYLVQYKCDDYGDVEETQYDINAIIPVKYQTIFDRIFSIPNPLDCIDNEKFVDECDKCIIGLCRDSNRNIMGVVIIDCKGLEGKKYGIY